MCDLWHLSIFYKLIRIWLLGVSFELVLCSTRDIHRIVLKTHHRKNKDPDNYRYAPDYRQTRKSTVHESNEDNWSSESIKNSDYYYNNYRLSHKNENNNEYKRGKFRNFSTVKPQQTSSHRANVVQFATAFPEKLPLPVIKSTFHNYYRPPSNNSLDSYTPNEFKQRQNGSSSGKVRQLREKETTTAKGYEVYEEIIEDTTPPPPPDLLLNYIQNLPVGETSSPPVVAQENVENRVKGNVSDLSKNSNRTYQQRIKLLRNRGNIKFE